MAEPLVKITVSRNSSLKTDKTMIELIKSRQTEELVIAICGAVGSGTSTIAKTIETIFQEYEYSTCLIKISKLIDKNRHHVRKELQKDLFLREAYISRLDPDSDFNEIDSGDRIALLQSTGNHLRKKASMDILAQLAIKEIALERDKEEDPEDNEEAPDRKSRRHVTIIDSFKNPKEVELLQLVYRDMFFLFGVLCPENIRENRLKNEKYIDPTKVIQLIERDKSEGEKYGQQFLKTILHSDFFVTNSAENIDALRPNLDRYVKIMMGDKSITPTKEENAMYHAQSAAAKSGCLSKQVGAAIIDEDGNLLSTGYNDVPKAGGGLYTIENGKDDSRCMLRHGGKCINQNRKNDIFNEIDMILKDCLGDKRKTLTCESDTNELFFDTISKKIRNHARLKNLTEFCRAIHAEMDAITSAARSGVIQLKNASLFSTTFPCHNCAKHIVATGITKVYYIEPYEKSMASNLHSDAISFDPSNPQDNTKFVTFIPFEGVSPKKYLKLFLSEDRKQDGARQKFYFRKSKPSIPVLIDTRYEYESRVVKYLDEIGFQE